MSTTWTKESAQLDSFSKEALSAKTWTKEAQQINLFSEALSSRVPNWSHPARFDYVGCGFDEAVFDDAIFDNLQMTIIGMPDWEKALQLTSRFSKDVLTDSTWTKEVQPINRFSKTTSATNPVWSRGA